MGGFHKVYSDNARVTNLFHYGKEGQSVYVELQPKDIWALASKLKKKGYDGKFDCRSLYLVDPDNCETIKLTRLTIVEQSTNLFD